MKVIQIAALDDLEAAKKRKVEAQHTVLVGWQGTWVELDLCEANLTGVEASILPLMKAGHEPGAPPTGATKGHDKRSLAYYKGLRAWADSQNRSYTTTSGQYKYPRALIADYDAYLVSQAGKEG